MNHTYPSHFTLVLGSGGVKSVAGLGVMQVLEREGLRPSSYAGCSAGAVFCALLASGHSASTAIDLARGLWSREVTSQRRHRALLELALPRFGNSGRFAETFALRDDRLIRERLHQAFGNSRIEALATPLRIQATCAQTGRGVLLQQGRVDLALRASIALPFLFAPQQIDGQWLVDGSLSQPLPLSAVDTGSVALALGFRVPFPKRCDSPTRLATRVTAALSNNLLDAGLAAADTPRLVALLPEPSRRIGLFDTEAMPELLALGRQAAEQALPRLLSLLGYRQQRVANG
jgi:NTE family protein